MCLGQILVAERRFKLSYHDETRGCLFDFCERRQDIVEGLRNKRFNHKSCRGKIKDADLLAAIDVLMAI